MINIEDHKNIHWWHKIKLNNGEYTNGECDAELLRKWYLFDEMDFKNKSVLDVGCWDGYYSFEAEKLGASRMVSLDDCNFRWSDYKGYEFLHEYFNSKAEFVIGNVYTLDTKFRQKEFDIILCYGVLYHLSDPLLALKNLFYVCNDKIAIEGLFFESDIPSLELIPLGKYYNDKGNVYSSSIKYLSDVANLCGFKIIKKQYSDIRATIILERISDCIDFYNKSVFPL